MSGETAGRRAGRYLKQVRESRGLTLEQVARDLNWGYSYLQKLESSRDKFPDIWEMEALCSYYGIDQDDVIMAAGFSLRRVREEFADVDEERPRTPAIVR